MSAPLLPAPPIDFPPSAWPQIILYAATVLLEAEGEPDDGKLAVAWVIRNRMDARDTDVAGVVLAPMQFSCFNEDYAGMRRARLTAPDPVQWEACWRAACAAHWRLLPDPSLGSNHYLNPTLTKTTRAGNRLPQWYDLMKVMVKIGSHEFLRLT